MTKTNMHMKRLTSNAARQDLGLYIHIPFCIKKCDYCDFLSAPAKEETIRQYVRALITEIKSYAGSLENYLVPTIFLGGGTPSSIDPSYIKEILAAVFETFPIDSARLEATIEANPGTVCRKKLMIYRGAGINRLSFGLQSTDDKELRLLGRIHTYQQFLENYNLARELGYDNINIDLISALPGQTIESWEQTLHRTVDLRPEHISAYSLIIEEGTPFYARYAEDATQNAQLPDEESDRRIYHRTGEILAEYGYHRYEISNYAQEGCESRHNISYWTGTQYLGLGLGAASLFQGTRFHNRTDIEQYISGWNDYENTGKLTADMRREVEKLSLKCRMEEFMFLGLRMCRGVSRKEFQERFQSSMDSVYANVLRQLREDKLLVIEGDRLYLTDYGIDISNYVLSQFLLD